jgi:hypothetical protein
MMNHPSLVQVINRNTDRLMNEMFKQALRAVVRGTVVLKASSPAAFTKSVAAQPTYHK